MEKLADDFESIPTVPNIIDSKPAVHPEAELEVSEEGVSVATSIPALHPAERAYIAEALYSERARRA